VEARQEMALLLQAQHQKQRRLSLILAGVSGLIHMGPIAIALMFLTLLVNAISIALLMKDQYPAVKPLLMFTRQGQGLRLSKRHLRFDGFQGPK
jgi:hypothetical protein